MPRPTKLKYDDFLVGAHGHDDPTAGSYAGTAYLVLGSPSVASASLADANAQLTGESSYDAAGDSVAAAGDINADGYDDFLIGAYAYSDSTSGSYAGAVYLVLGSPSVASASLTDADARLTGESSDDYAGRSVSPAGDVNADGYDDFLVGAYGYDDPSIGSYAGATYLLLGRGGL